MTPPHVMAGLRPGHPRLWARTALKAWMPATSAGMTKLVSYPRDRMKERAADMAAPAAGAADPLALCVGKIENSFIGARRDQRRMVEFVSPYRAAGLSERAVGEEPRFPVAEMQLGRGEAGRVSEQADHCMPPPLRVLKAFAQHHVAAALAVHRAGRPKSSQPLAETIGICQHAGMSLRIAAGDPAGVAVARGRPVGGRRKG